MGKTGGQTWSEGGNPSGWLNRLSFFAAYPEGQYFICPPGMTWHETEKRCAGRVRFYSHSRKGRRERWTKREKSTHLVPSHIDNRDVCRPRVPRQNEELEMNTLSRVERVDVGLVVFVPHASAKIPAKPTGVVRALEEVEADASEEREADH